jgi:hypothetical protein
MPSVGACLAPACLSGRFQHPLLETDNMTDLPSAPSASTPARDELARQLLAVVLHPNQRLSDELDYWLGMIQGTAAYLAVTCDQDHFRDRAFSTSPDEVSALAALLQRSAAITRVLAGGMGEGGL